MFIGGLAPPEGLIGRADEVEDIVSRIRSKIGYNLALIGHRRIGKSSILATVEKILSQDDKTIVVNFDVQYNLGDPRTLLKSLQSAIFEAAFKKLNMRQRLKSRYRDPFSRIASILASKKIKGVSIEVSSDTATGEIKARPKLEFVDKERDYRSMFEMVFSTVNALADEFGMKFVVILDEFQDVTKLGRYKGLKNVIDLFRGVIQQRSKNVSYIVCGSHVHMLKTMMSEGESSSFQHFQQIPVRDMKKDEALMLFNKYLKDRDHRSNSKLAREAYDLVGGHPYYLMALAEEWRPDHSLSEIFEKSLSSSVGVLRLYVNYVISESISRAQGGPTLYSILKELAKSDSGMTYTGIGKKLIEPASSIVPYVNELVKVDLVEKNKTYAIRDKVVKQYLLMQLSDLQ